MKPVFVQTKNVRSFVPFMQLIESRHGCDSIGSLSARAGRGKTKTAKWYATQHGSVYIESIRGWSELWMYQDILKAMGIIDPPQRKKGCFEAIVDISRETPRTMFLDEADLIGLRLLESVRDLCKFMMVPWVLIGEESLPQMLGRDRRVWSRQAAALEFGPMESADIIALCKEATDAGLMMTPQVASVIQQKTGGDIRLIELVLSNSEPMARANSSKELTEEMAKKALQRMGVEKRLAA
jgi:DNA transposition AAA+ family ATPase